MIRISLAIALIASFCFSLSEASLDSEGIKKLYNEIFAKKGGNPMSFDELSKHFDDLLAVKDANLDALTEEQWKDIGKLNSAIKMEETHCSDTGLWWYSCMISKYYPHQVNIVPNLRKSKQNYYLYCMEQQAIKANFSPEHNSNLDQLYKMGWNHKTGGVSISGIWDYMKLKDPSVIERRYDRSWRNFMTDYDNLVRNMCLGNGKQLGRMLKIQECAERDPDLTDILESNPKLKDMVEKQAFCNLIAEDPAFLGSRVWFFSMPLAVRVANFLRL